MSDLANYPEHQKVKAIQHQSQVVHEFLEWLESEKIELAQVESEDAFFIKYWPIRERREDLVARFFGIDLKEFNKEKDRMYNELRTHSETRNAQSN